MRKQKIIHGPRVTHIAAVTTAALLALTACGTETKDGSGAGSGTGNRAGGGSVETDLPLTGVRWSVDSVTVDGRKTAAPAGAGVEISPQGRASAQTGCNRISADVTVEGDTVTVGEKDATLVGCDKEMESFEKALDGAFAGKLTAKVQDEKLTLTTADGDTIALTSEGPEEAAPLAGTRWTVGSLTDDDTATSVPQGAEGKAFFTITLGKEAQAGKDGERTGSVEGSLGCNRFKAPATVTDTTLTLGRITATRKLCPGPGMTLERQVQKVLEGKVTYELRHRDLTLRTAEGEGIGALATAPEK
ncbi:META domain-containing protein [Streptomyces sp. NPDC088124]|uniref:META domain-containing protein n=1 Tax=Streptomyces sp. NPDC088124 TaxID=3154654 RepID=UPI00344392EC